MFIAADFLFAVASGGGIKDCCEFDNGFVVSNKIEMVVIAEPRDGTRSFTACNWLTKFCNSVRISSLASCSVKRCSAKIHKNKIPTLIDLCVCVVRAISIYHGVIHFMVIFLNRYQLAING